jgi:hypothetical protein
MTILPPLINGKSYENADVNLNIMGTLIAGVKAITFGEMLNDMDGVTGAGRDYVSYVNGKLKKTGSITLLYEEVVNIEAVAPLGKIFDIPMFPISVSFTDATLVTHSYVITAKFKGYNMDTKDGDTAIPIELPLFIGSIVKTA